MPHQPTPPPPFQEAQPLRNQHMLKFITLVMSCAATAKFVLMQLSLDGPLETAVVGLFCVCSWGCYLAIGRARFQFGAAWLITCVLAMAVLSVLTFGSVRTTANFLFVGAVAGAGILLGRKALGMLAFFDESRDDMDQFRQEAIHFILKLERALKGAK